MRIVCQQTILMKYHALFVILKKWKILNCRLLQIIGCAYGLIGLCSNTKMVLLYCLFYMRLKDKFIRRNHYFLKTTSRNNYHIYSYTPPDVKFSVL